jgi:GAF domain-containing protein
MRHRGGSEQPVKKRRANGPKGRKVSTAGPSVADLQEQVGALTRELKEAREQQTATADVLKLISGSAFELGSVLQTVVRTAVRLCRADQATIYREENGEYRWAADYSLAPDYARIERNVRIRPGVGTLVGRVALSHDTVQILDAWTDPLYEVKEDARVGNVHTMLGVPLLREGLPIGAIGLGREKIEPYTEEEIALVRTFADQAVIAIENTRLFNETREALERQTATARVLQVINASPGNLKPVFDAMLDNAMRLCEAPMGGLVVPDGELARWVARRGVPEVFDDWISHAKIQLSSLLGPALRDRSISVLHVLDMKETEGYRKRNPFLVATVELGGGRTGVVVPLVKDDALVGVFAIYRQEARAFSDTQIALLQNFAAQAVIAMENARLLTETREALERQTATADILEVIASSPENVQPVFQAIADRSNRLVDALSTTVFRLVDGMVHLRAFTPTTPQADAKLQALFPAPLSTFSWGEAIGKGNIYRVIDAEQEPEELRQVARERGWRSALIVPLLRDGKPIGMIGPTRVEPGPFNEHHVQLMQTFADQAVIAIQNVELFEKVQARTRELSQSLDDLRAAQDRLVQTQKLASLGQLTAGIAHEIKNPLNFVNTFAALSVELTDELKGALKPAVLDRTIRTEVDEITGLLKDNLGKVVQHGRRADSIVKNMLLHSREGSGERRSTQINALVGESLNLAYHGARAEKPGFAITLKHDFDPDAGALDVYPQELTRALLNLISNGFYAASKRKLEAGNDEI